MQTRVFSGGAEQTSGKAKQWGKNKRQARAALALAVSLWIAGGGVAMAENVTTNTEISGDQSTTGYN